MTVKIVIFEDDPVTLEMLSSCLSLQGYEVLAFPEPQMCPLYADPTCQCRQSRPCAEILITDNRMPRMTGMEFIRAQTLRGCKGNIRYKALISGQLNAAEVEEARALGCQVFRKPVVLKELFEWLDGCKQEILARRTADE